jgi:hypothetical protein
MDANHQGFKMASLTLGSLSLAISLLAVAISAFTLWWTSFRRGTIKMTQPATIYFGPDENGSPKVYLRSLLYSTSKRGQLIEHMYVTLRRGETRQTFNIWVYGDRELARGSGLFVGDNGLTANHHFLLPAQETGFQFRPGDYALEVHARRVGVQASEVLARANLAITEQESAHISSGSGGVYYDWGPESARYHSHFGIKSAVKKYSDTDVASLIRTMTDAISGKSEDKPD